MEKAADYDQYAELYHYTNAKGLHGILTEQCLWATNISFLNDEKERTHYIDERMPSLLEQAIRSYFDDFAKIPELAASFKQIGGYEKAVDELLKGMMQGINNVALLDEPYVTSFCGARSERVARNGLLSQWRAYGSDGGYAVVFDTKALTLLLNEEFDKYMYIHPRWGVVHYYDGHGSDALMQKKFHESEEIIKSSIVGFLKTRDRESLRPFFDKVYLLTCFTKHCGFDEENEVRVVATRRTEAIGRESRGEGLPVKPVHYRPRNGMLIPYIRLFENITNKDSIAPPDKKLPIKAIIVGPHPDKEKRCKAIELLLKQYGVDAKVWCSDIPYLPS